ncbi:methylated-DNA--[protein]-cysteine S-methyltransferase [Polaromonas sp. C04]|uniref:methylated-DNA--[protein]-cysteine S-methyltransferase n=1 Tax=Polaromonas sp. C04 TaxID=1945857 RepID=UPI0009858748|nr:methylated-DNA--[protein]-cysteine S-methyltransferase [Polaromonas sp. C04]OOG51829.1 cysteine methyltransferase [Polaromonas sp. C04]
MATSGFSLFDTAIGRCGIAWGEHGIYGVQLPEANDHATRVRLRRPAGAQEALPPPAVQCVIDAVVALLRGERCEPDVLGAAPLDMQGVPPFNRRVYEVTRAIAPGATLTYGEVAARIGEPGAARAVGQALGHNPFAPVVPCHRVLAAGSGAGGFSARGGVTTKLRMLLIEGAAFGAPGLFDAPDAREKSL